MGGKPIRIPIAAAWLWTAATWVIAPAALAQEAIHTDSTAVPSAGQVALRESVQYVRLRDDPTPGGREVDEWRSLTTVEYGIRQDVTLAAYLPLVYRETRFGGTPPGGAGADRNTAEFGLDDFTLAVKWRVYRNDFGPINTARFSLVAGAELPAGADFSSDSVDPVFGGVFNYIRGRHGFDADLLWKFNTGGEGDPVRAGEGSADALFYNAAYLFRVEPASFSAGSSGALYAVVEANGAYETNGDNELLVAPGVLFEVPQFAVEASVQLPVWQDLSHRPETQFTVTLGVRFLF
jgi:hypothetical protein